MQKKYFIRILIFFLLFITGLALCGCIKFDALKQANQAITYYTLSYPPPSDVKTLDVTVRMRRFLAAAIYNTDRLVIQNDPYTTEYDYYHRWRVNPATLVTDFLLRDLGAANLFKAILTRPSHLLPDYELSGTVESIRAYAGDSGWKAELALNIVFYPLPLDNKQSDSETIFQKRYQIALPCRNDNPLSIVKALNNCMQEMSLTIQKDLTAYLMDRN